MKDERSRELKVDHFAEALQVIQMTYGLNMKQLSDEVGLNRSTMWRYLHKEKLVRRGYKEMILTKLKQIIRNGKSDNITYFHRYLKRH